MLAQLLSRSGHDYNLAFLSSLSLIFTFFSLLGHTRRLRVLDSLACHGETRRDKIDPQAQLPGAGVGEGEGEGELSLGVYFVPSRFPMTSLRQNPQSPSVSMRLRYIQHAYIPLGRGRGGKEMKM